jgi:hypothetical protein
MTEKKHKTTAQVEGDHDYSATGSPQLKANPAEAVRARGKSFQSGSDCQDALMRCYNR